MKRILPLLTFIFLFILPVITWAQGAGAPNLPAPPDQAPLGGIEWLALMGGAYAVKKLRDRKK